MSRYPYLVAIKGNTLGSEPSYRKVAAVVGPSRVEGKVRAALWSQQGRCWSTVRALEEWRIVGPAPSEWLQTRAATRHLGDLP